MRAVFSMLFGLYLFAATAQTKQLPSPPPGLKYQLNYDLEETSFFLSANETPSKDMSPLDLEKMQPYTIVKQVETRVAEDNHYSSTVKILNPAEAYAEFPIHIGRIEINDSGMQVFDTNNALYQDFPADDIYRKDYENAQKRLEKKLPKIMYEFPPAPDAATIQQIEAMGGSVVLLPDGAWKLTMGDNVTLYEPASSRITTSKGKGKTPSETFIQKFLLTEQGIYAPLVETTKKAIIRPSGACMQDVRIKHYSNYLLAISPEERSNADKSYELDDNRVWPNPASDKLNIALGQSIQAGALLRVFDIVGKVSYSQSGVQAGDQLAIPLTGWANGVYFVRLETKSGPKIFKFIKKAE